MRFAAYVKQWHVRRLYKLAQIGIYDDDLLLEVGWGFYARCADVLTVIRALSGELPCPRCSHIVHRPKYYRGLKLGNKENQQKVLSCPNCYLKLNWQDCRKALRNHPKCFNCQTSLEWKYMKNTISCNHCNKEWSWQQYRQSIKNRTRLPCPYCGKLISRTKLDPNYQKSIHSNASDAISSLWEDLKCPGCSCFGIHNEGKFRCLQCGYNTAWRNYVRRLKRRAEFLQCKICGHKFSWNSWRNQFQSSGSLTTGNPAPIKTFIIEWPRCKTPQEQLIQIDNIIHALHDRGALAPLFIEGDSTKVMTFLDELALN